MTHLVDTSVWHKYGRYPGVARVIDELDQTGAIFATCPPVVAEYCFSATNPSELAAMQDEMAQFYQLDGQQLMSSIHTIQKALTQRGLHRAVGATDTVIAAYALATEQILVTCDKDFLHIAIAMEGARNRGRLLVTHITETGEITQR